MSSVIAKRHSVYRGFVLGAALFLLGANSFTHPVSAVEDELTAEVSELFEDMATNEALVQSLVGKTILSISRLEPEERAYIEQTILTDKPVYVYPAQGGILKNEHDELEVVPNAVIMLDYDADGLSNELESRIGSDPNRKDTDDDGFDDRSELQNGFAPLDDGKETIELLPFDEAIVAERPLGQPVLSNATYDDAISLSFEKDPSGSHIISGKGPANELIALYIYSTLPLVVTTESDNKGYYSYTLDDVLADSKHVVYATVIDSSGEIVTKSRGFSFQFNENNSSSITAQEISHTFGAKQAPVQEMVYDSVVLVMIYTTVLISVSAIGMALFLIFRKRIRKRPGFVDDDTQ